MFHFVTNDAIIYTESCFENNVTFTVFKVFLGLLVLVIKIIACTCKMVD